MELEIAISASSGFRSHSILLFLFGSESPRYLISKNNHDKAKEIFVRYRDAGDPGSVLVQYQMAEISATIEAEQIQKDSKWIEWFKSKAMSHRLLHRPGTVANASIMWKLYHLLLSFGHAQRYQYHLEYQQT